MADIAAEPIRGSQAPASLKRPLAGRVCATRGAYPGLPSPGLIEASHGLA